MIKVVAAFIHKGDRFLICQRPLDKARGGYWEFPGGKLEAGETPEQALARECREELASDIDVGNKITEVVHEYPDMTVQVSLYEATVAGREPQQIEHIDMRWVTVDEMDDFEFCPADVDILATLHERALKGAQ